MADCIVVGGGVIGMLTARSLHGAGANVCLLERGWLGQEASWAAGGILSPLYPWRYARPISDLARISQALYTRLAEELKQETGIDVQWTQSGLLVFDIEERQAAEAWGRDLGAPVEYLDAGALKEIEPALADSREAALWLPSIAQVRSPRLIKALRASLDRRRIDYRERTAVIGLTLQQDHVTGVSTTRETLSAETVILAGGAWSPQLVPESSLPLDVEPVRGQMILFKTNPDTLRRLMLARDHYLIPRRDGHILAGSTLEYVGFEKETTKTAREALRRVAVELLPALKTLPIEHHWSGLRPGSPAGMPYIGEHPQIKGLYANTGHFRNGVVLAPASAQLATDLVLEREPALAPEPFALDAPR